MMITLMKLLFSNQYNNMLDIIKNLMEENERLKADNARLSRDLTDLQNFCIRFANDNTKFGNAYNLDFPNSEKSYEDKIY